MTEWMIASTLGFALGGTFVWFGKSTIQQAVLGANALSKKLHAEADTISGAIKRP